MLINAKPTLEQDIKDIFKESLYEAYMTQYTGSGEDYISKSVKQSTEKSAKLFSEEAAELISKPLAEAIYKFVLEIGIEAKPNKLTSTNGPVSGVISNDEFKIN